MKITIQEVQQFIHYQNILTQKMNQLAYAMKVNNPDIVVHDLFGWIMRLDSGNFEMNGGEIWYFWRHGLGVKFVLTNGTSRISVDVHDYYDQPNIFDSDRFTYYLNSVYNESFDCRAIKAELLQLMQNTKHLRLIDQTYAAYFEWIE